MGATDEPANRVFNWNEGYDAPTVGTSSYASKSWWCRLAARPAAKNGKSFSD
jgi:hypothetical protein